ncbi:sensor histidine kinase [Cellulomonas sp.]|uniref:sensor histidine kinase n=1 Tax=Cellulomonas sp. TaxID=40001 RepID=UPI002582C99A|nr:sensor histidine kinase [Cellulomonas sp.]MCR6688413.1 sensor histidine kinase [Cellulomonas sp.]
MPATLPPVPPPPVADRRTRDPGPSTPAPTTAPRGVSWHAAARTDVPIGLAVGGLWSLGLLVAMRSANWMPLSIEGYWWAGLWLTISLATWRAAPRASFWVVAVGYPVTYSFVVTDGWGMSSPSHILPLLVAAFGVTRSGGLRVVPAVVASVGAELVLSAGLAGATRGVTGGEWFPAIDRSSAVQLTALVVAAAVIGSIMRRLALTSASLEQRNAELLALQEVRARAAVRDERTRIARELHDVVAHHVSAIVVRAQAADRVADRDPQAPREAVRWIAPAGREALDAMRSVVRVLRAADDESAPLAPTAGLESLPAVVERVRAAGVVVTAELPAPLPACPPAVGLAVVRVAQEALTNVLVHSAATEAALTLSVAGGTLVLDVRDPGPPRAEASRGGNGLVHMRERAAAAGGTLAVGPAPDGGWRVLLMVPTNGRDGAVR